MQSPEPAPLQPPEPRRTTRHSASRAPSRTAPRAASRTPASPGATESVATDDVGGRIRKLRSLFGLSQRELAKRAGVTNGSISLIEQNRVSPSVSSLKKIVGGFPLSLGEFFSFDVESSLKGFYRADELTEIRADHVLMRLVGPARDDAVGRQRKLQVLHEFYDPGGDTGDAMLSHEGEEAGVVVRGEVEITVGGETRCLGAGDAYYFDSRLPHRFCNVGASVCEIVSVCTPPSF